jgi:hypothetical protein
MNTADHSTGVFVQEKRIAVDLQRRDDGWILGLFKYFYYNPSVGLPLSKTMICQT